VRNNQDDKTKHVRTKIILLKNLLKCVLINSSYISKLIYGMIKVFSFQNENMKNISYHVLNTMILFSLLNTVTEPL